MSGAVSLQNSVETGHEDMIVSATINYSVQIKYLCVHKHMYEL